MKNVVRSRSQYLQKLVAGKNVLDIGCVGRPSQPFTDPYWLHGKMRESAQSVFGLDNNEEAIRELQKQGFNVQCADCSKFDVGRKFDVVVAGELIEHLVNHEGFFASVRKHLGPEGILVITTPNALCLTYVIQNIIHGREEEFADHTCLFSPTTLRTMLAQNGFDLSKVVYFTKFEFQKIPWTRRIFEWIQLTIALLRPSFCHYFIAECGLKPTTT